MINDFMEVENAEGMPELADSALAMEFLISIKTGIRNAAFALTEAYTPDVRDEFYHQLKAGIKLQEELMQLMFKKDWLNPYEMKEQYIMDEKSVKAALMIGSLKLFPGDTSRMGMMAQIDSDE